MNGSGGRLKTQVLIVGGGIAGTGLARDLALRGLECIVVEKGHINSGASGANQGLLHSGARYVSNDPVTARECRAESILLKQLAPACIEDTGGLFVAVAGDDERYIADFPLFCERSGIPVEAVDRLEARELEPGLTEDLIAAYRVEDATVDPFRLSFENMADAANHGARLMIHAQVVGMARRGNRIEAARIRLLRTGEEVEIEAEQVVNAAGPWVGKVAALVGLEMPLLWSKGSMLISQLRISDRVVNRLRPPSDGDIVAPGGTVSLMGTTSVRVSDIESLRTETEEVDFLLKEASKMFPAVLETCLVRAFAGVRPLAGGHAAADDRVVSRGFQLIDHEKDGIANFLTIMGGKLTTYRLTAEEAADLVCRRLGVNSPCLTRGVPLPNAAENKWVEAGLAPLIWLRTKKPDDALLCECEMVPASAVAQIVARLRADSQTVDLDTIRLHSRMGKGSCQGAFCSLRTMAFLYDLGVFEKDGGIRDLQAFLEARWKGLRPVLWGGQLAREELQEAVHCGLFNLESLR